MKTIFKHEKKYFGHVCSMQIFLGQGFNLSKNKRHNSDNMLSQQGMPKEKYLKKKNEEL